MIHEQLSRNRDAWNKTVKGRFNNVGVLLAFGWMLSITPDWLELHIGLLVGVQWERHTCTMSLRLASSMMRRIWILEMHGTGN